MKLARESSVATTLAALALLLVVATGCVQPAYAQQVSNEDVWQFEIIPYLFAAGLKGTVGFRGVTANIDAGAEDLIDNLNKAFMLSATAEKDKWVFALDTIYFNLEGEGAQSWQGPLGNSSSAELNADVKEQLFAFSGGRRLVDNRSNVDLMAVARYTSLENTLSLKLTTGPDLLPDGSRSITREKSWWDAALALRGKLPIARKWVLTGYADVGAGGSDLTYQIMLGVNWQFSSTVTAKFVYRYLYQDYTNDDFVWDMATRGAMLGVGFQF